MNVTDKIDIGPIQNPEIIDAASGVIVPADSVEFGNISKMEKEPERDPMEKRGWVTMDSKGRTGFATIDDSFADLMSHHTVEVTAEGKPVRVEPYAYVDE